jgi:AcrR family transcriptional regulator
MTSSTASHRPRGRDQIRAALIASTLALLEEEGLDISIRQIAERANVPHSVIGRYFGSKDELIRSAIDSTLPADQEMASHLQTAEQAAIEAFDSVFERPERIRILTQLLQAGMTPREIRSEAPVLAALVKLVEAEQPAHADPRIIAVAIYSLSVGLVLAEDYVVDHAGLGVLDREDIRTQVRDVMLRLL